MASLGSGLCVTDDSSTLDPVLLRLVSFPYHFAGTLTQSPYPRLATDGGASCAFRRVSVTSGDRSYAVDDRPAPSPLRPFYSAGASYRSRVLEIRSCVLFDVSSAMASLPSCATSRSMSLNDWAWPCPCGLPRWIGCLPSVSFEYPAGLPFSASPSPRRVPNPSSAREIRRPLWPGGSCYACSCP